MKTLLKLILIAVVLTAFALPGFSAESCCKSGHAHVKAAHCGHKSDCCDNLKKELNLTEEQQAKLDNIKKECMALQKKVSAEIADLCKKKCALICGDKMDKDAAFKIIDKLAKLRASQQKNCVDCKVKFHSLLTPEQLKKMKELKAKCKTHCTTQHEAHANACCKDGHKAHCCDHGKKKGC